jgi:hypothetical protein
VIHNGTSFSNIPLSLHMKSSLSQRMPSLFLFRYLFKHSISRSLSFVLSSLLLLFVLRFDLPRAARVLLFVADARASGNPAVVSLLLFSSCSCSFAGDSFSMPLFFLQRSQFHTKC